jgi:dihydrodipicolinate synthase/N-acetylneuraminate lyase
MIQNKIKGVGVALITPFNNYEVDYPALERMVEHVITGGVDYIVALGSTAETATLSFAERQRVLDFIIDHTAGRVPIVAGMGTNDTHALVEQLRTFDLSRTIGILSVVPYYNKPSQEGIYRHYMAVAEASPVPVIIYNVPGRTGVNMTAATTLRLAHATDKIVAVKDHIFYSYSLIHIYPVTKNGDCCLVGAYFYSEPQMTLRHLKIPLFKKCHKLLCRLNIINITAQKLKTVLIRKLRAIYAVFVKTVYRFLGR